MGFDVPTPDPPSLTDSQPRGAPDADAGEDYRRDQIAAVFEAGAWNEAFEAWAEQTWLSESEFDLLEAHDCFETMDFYWDAGTEAVGYHIPDLSDDAREALGSDDAGDVESELAALGQVVAETLAEQYHTGDGEFVAKEGT